MRLTDVEARTRFTAARVARLATAGGDGRPHIVPVTFAVNAGAVNAGAASVVTAVDHKPKSTLGGLRRLRNITENPQVSLLVDAYDDDWSRLWWARADGEARIVRAGEPGHAPAVELLIARYDQYQAAPPAGPAIIVTVARWSGWAFSA
ncbi:PPOX class F420-dependent oxidoreductase [Frankia sp. CcI156]|uniref:TIGR03668 family PPOX class F420-dependent oxidoreductase n=1 Tax=Frankia TaxID=1854 RepID=UPI0003D01E3E|nr:MULTISPECIES: TIGR03668 family PPOX class F420-dependent oxidoreductase [Frankia]ETA01823.1 hypothetical protein CcI6DRAFT_02671 [Frankia sp. CcI6]EYT92566.1 hypothetical protein ThrDRAFT_01849 [Frankia casuarinae]KDA43085.1 hypothetical protein BMG523Draft_02140 [Frankia sp. BMG5.23]OAA24351.1 PPOX class probable F420-dependent enzyme, Rv0121 family [Frankia casuarinae]OHV53836.1 PPOX class F420-dependent oxidoreductase [Frankia sp. CgIS1]